jgi:hypothetical protein
MYIMKRKFTQWCSTILKIVTKGAMTSDLNSPNTKNKQQRHLKLDIQVLTWNRHKKCGGVKPVNGKLAPSPPSYWKLDLQWPYLYEKMYILQLRVKINPELTRFKATRWLLFVFIKCVRHNNYIHHVRWYIKRW